MLDEYYGLQAGLPAYALAGLIGWSRLDERDHDLSDVVFGAALGFVIGKSVARDHLYGDSRVRLLPYVHPTDGTTDDRRDPEIASARSGSSGPDRQRGTALCQVAAGYPQIWL